MKSRRVVSRCALGRQHRAVSRRSFDRPQFVMILTDTCSNAANREEVEYRFVRTVVTDDRIVDNSADYAADEATTSRAAAWMN